MYIYVYVYIYVHVYIYIYIIIIYIYMRPHNQHQSLNLGLAQCPQPKFIEWFGVIAKHHVYSVDQSLLNLINYAFLLMKGMAAG